MFKLHLQVLRFWLPCPSTSKRSHVLCSANHLVLDFLHSQYLRSLLIFEIASHSYVLTLLATCLAFCSLVSSPLWSWAQTTVVRSLMLSLELHSHIALFLTCTPYSISKRGLILRWFWIFTQVVFRISLVPWLLVSHILLTIILFVSRLLILHTLWPEFTHCLFLPFTDFPVHL